MVEYLFTDPTNALSILAGGGGNEFLKVIAHLIGMELSQNPEISLRDATANALVR